MSDAGSSQLSRLGLLALRYGIGLVLILAGVVLLIVDPGGFGVEGFGLGAGAGSSIILLNWLFRLGVAGDQERAREQAARDYLSKYGRWPDERPRVPTSDGARRIPPAEAAAQSAARELPGGRRDAEVARHPHRSPPHRDALGQRSRPWQRHAAPRRRGGD
jgi:hypothetical protein